MGVPTINSLRGRLFTLPLGPFVAGDLPLLTVPPRRRYVIRSFHLHFVLGGGGTARQLIYRAKDGTIEIFETKAPAPATPGDGFTFVFADYGTEEGNFSDFIPVALPAYPLSPGNTVEIEVINHNVLDLFSAVTARVEEWVV